MRGHPGFGGRQGRLESPPQPAAVDELDEAAGVRQNTALDCPQAGQDPAPTVEPEHGARPAHALGHSSAVGEQQPEHARLARTAHPEADRRYAPDDLSRRPDDDHHSQPKPDGEASPRGRPRGEEHELGVVAGLGTPRECADTVSAAAAPGASVSRRGPTASQDDRAGTARGRPAQVERESGAGHVDDDGASAGVRHRDRRTGRALEVRRGTATRSMRRGRGGRPRGAGGGDQGGESGGGGERPHRPISV